MSECTITVYPDPEEMAAEIASLKRQLSEANAKLERCRREAWREMKDAPEIEGQEIIAMERDGGRARRYRWQEKPVRVGNTDIPVERGWVAKQEGVMIRRSYQERYVWVPLPSTLSTEQPEQKVQL